MAGIVVAAASNSLRGLQPRGTATPSCLALQGLSRDLTYEACSIVINHSNALYEAEEIAVAVVEAFALSNWIMAKRAAYDVAA
jgi:hypothetical protein